MSDPVPTGNEQHSQQPKVNTILVVDDSSVNRLLMRSIIALEDVKITTAADGAQALACVKEEPPVLIFLDVMMMGMNGFEVLQRLKGDAATADIPVIMVTGLDDHESMNRALEAGADDVLTKPVNMEDVLAQVRRVCASLRSDVSEDEPRVSS